MTHTLQPIITALETQTDSELIALYKETEQIQDQIEILDPQYKQLVVIKVSIEELFVSRHGEKVGTEMIDAICN